MICNLLREIVYFQNFSCFVVRLLSSCNSVLSSRNDSLSDMSCQILLGICYQCAFSNMENSKYNFLFWLSILFPPTQFENLIITYIFWFDDIAFVHSDYSIFKLFVSLAKLIYNCCSGHDITEMLLKVALSTNQCTVALSCIDFY